MVGRRKRRSRETQSVLAALSTMARAGPPKSAVSLPHLWDETCQPRWIVFLFSLWFLGGVLLSDQTASRLLASVCEPATFGEVEGTPIPFVSEARAGQNVNSPALSATVFLRASDRTSVLKHLFAITAAIETIRFSA